MKNKDDDSFTMEIQKVNNMHPDKVKILTHPKNYDYIKSLLRILEHHLNRYEK